MYLVRLIGVLVVWPLWIIFMWIFYLIGCTAIYIWYLDFKHCKLPLKAKDYYFYLCKDGYNLELEDGYPVKYRFDSYYRTPLDMLRNKLTQIEY